jgi:hypothetical protein
MYWKNNKTCATHHPSASKQSRKQQQGRVFFSIAGMKQERGKINSTVHAAAAKKHDRRAHRASE